MGHFGDGGASFGDGDVFVHGSGGSTRRWEDDTDAMRAAVARHDVLLEEGDHRQGGVVFSRMGDGMAAAFAVGAPRHRGCG